MNDIKKDITYSATFDISYEYLNYRMYDCMPYIRNYELCNEANIKLFSGNIIKGYRCKIDTPRLIQA